VCEGGFDSRRNQGKEHANAVADERDADDL